MRRGLGKLGPRFFFERGDASRLTSAGIQPLLRLRSITPFQRMLGANHDITPVAVSTFLVVWPTNGTYTNTTSLPGLPVAGVT